MNLKLYASTFKVGKCITKAFFKNLNILHKLFITKKNRLKQKVITKMMNHNNKIFSYKTLCFIFSFSFIFVEMELEP